MRIKTPLIAVLIAAAGAVDVSRGAAIIYTQTFVASGSLGGVAFNNVSLTMVATADTDDVEELDPLAGLYTVVNSSLTIAVPGFEVATFLNSTRSVTNYRQNETGIIGRSGFSDIDQQNLIVSTISEEFKETGFQLRTSFGPVNGTMNLYSPLQSPTDKGTLIFAPSQGIATFRAEIITEPTMSCLLGLGVFGLGLIFRRCSGSIAPRVKTSTICALALACLGSSVRADVFGSGGNTFSIDFVIIDNPGNGNDVGAGGGFYSSPYGGVSYVYQMGVTEVSQDWINKATASGLTNVTAGPWNGNQPATNITWYQAAAFVNWLNTSTGHQAAYQLNEMNTAMTLWTIDEAWQAGGQNLYRHKDAYYFLPSEDEWYKAAYHQNDGVTANYWDYATGSNTRPTPVASGTEAGTAVYSYFAVADVNNTGGLSPYGTRGQNGNVFELHESAFDALNDSPSEQRALRGGDFTGHSGELLVQTRYNADASNTSAIVGFRVASVPEPSLPLLIFSASVFAFARRRTRSTAGRGDQNSAGNGSAAYCV